MKEIRIPDLGGASDVEVIEVLVAPGDTVEAEDALVTLESDKASMDVPAPEAGTISEIKVSVVVAGAETDKALLALRKTFSVGSN